MDEHKYFIEYRILFIAQLYGMAVKIKLNGNKLLVYKAK